MKSRKTLKWIISTAMVLALLLTTLMTVSAAAVEFSLSSATVDAGDEVDVTFSVKGDNVGMFIAELDYDPAALIYKGHETFVPDVSVSEQVDVVNGVVYVNFSAPALDGALVTFTFETAATAEGVYPIEIAMDNVRTGSMALITDYTVSNGAVTVIQHVTDVSIQDSTTLNVGETETLVPVITPANATNQNVTWGSSDPTVATVDAAGVVTAVKAGTATITVTTVDGGFTDTCLVTVLQPVTGVTVSPTQATVEVGATETLTATVLPADASNKAVTWSTSDPAIATVVDGVVTGVSAGTATITVTTADGAFSANCEITVLQPPTSISLDQNTLTMDIGDVEQLTATVLPDNAADKSVTWTSSKDAVATVDAAGNVTAVKGGTATITATTVNGLEATCIVTVNPRTIPLTVTSGQELWLPITLDDCDGLVVVQGTLIYDTDLLTLRTVVGGDGFMITSGLNDPSKDDNKFNAGYFKNPMGGLDGTVVVGYAIFTTKADLTEEVKTYVTIEMEEILNGAGGDLTEATLPRYEVTITPIAPLPGDANLNGIIDLPDAILILQHLSKNNILTGRALKAADTNCDGQVNTLDAVMVMMMILPD